MYVLLQVVSRGNDQVAITSKFEARADTGMSVCVYVTCVCMWFNLHVLQLSSVTMGTCWRACVGLSLTELPASSPAMSTWYVTSCQ